MPDIPDRPQKEETLETVLRQAFGSTRQRIIQELGAPPTLANVSDSTWDQLRQTVAEDSKRAIIVVFLLGMRRIATEQHFMTNAEVAGRRAAEYAEARSRRLADGMVRTFQDRFRGHVQEAKRRLDGGATMAEVEADLKRAAEEIAAEQARNGGVTETTDANSAGEMDWKDIYEGETGVALVAVWNAEPDACEVCLPLDGQPEEVWREEFPRGPTAHPRCRCWLTFVPAEEFAEL